MGVTAFFLLDPLTNLVRCRYVHGYQGKKVLSMQAGESHAGVLMEQQGESDGGKIFTHGMANLGRLGIGPARKLKKSLLGRLRVKGKGSSDPVLDNPEPDFSALMAEPDPDDYQKEDTRYQPTPSQVILSPLVGFEDSLCPPPRWMLWRAHLHKLE